MEFAKDRQAAEACPSEYSDDKESEVNLNILEEHFEELNVDPVLENKEQVENLIRKYIKIIRLDCTDEVLKKKMIRKLCDLRLRQCELIEEAEINSVSGHQFKLETTTNYCDICMKKQNGLFIPLLNNLTYAQLNVCIYCGYSMHVECQSELFTTKKIRDCPKLLYERQLVKISPTKELNSFVILDICVEKSLSEQEYKCNDCAELICFETSQLCDYDGFYYCRNCHNNDLAIIPARVIHNWDFTPRPVSKSSNYTLNYVKNKPVLFNVLELNSMLYGFIDELPLVKRLRYELNLMVKYIILCKQPSKPKITISNHLIDSNLINSYSLFDLQDLPGLKKTLTDFHSELFEHITKNCETCKGNGFFCELCPGHNDRGGILFPFSPNISLCPKCHAVFHKNCYYRKKMCTRCKRIEKKDLKEGTESVRVEGLELKTVDAETKEHPGIVNSEPNRGTERANEQLEDDRLEDGQLKDGQVKEEDLLNDGLDENTRSEQNESKADDEAGEKIEEEEQSTIKSNEVTGVSPADRSETENGTTRNETTGQPEIDQSPLEN